MNFIQILMSLALIQSCLCTLLVLRARRKIDVLMVVLHRQATDITELQGALKKRGRVRVRRCNSDSGN